MLLKSLWLRNFRNYSELELKFPSSINLIVGDNAQGKTNLLEAIYFLCTAKSHRTRMDNELIKHGEDWFYLKGGLESRLSSTIIEISNTFAGRKRVKIDGKIQSKSSYLIGQTSVVIFSPESLALVKGSPADRRKFLDILISQIDPAYLRLLQKYQLVLKQRNELLKQIREKRAVVKTPAYVDWLSPWDNQLAQTGAVIMEKRADIVSKLANLAGEKYKGLTESDEALNVVYRKSYQSSDNSVTDAQLGESYYEALKSVRNSDIIKGTTSLGPHRDDLIISVDNFDAKRFGSQGQHRTITLSFKLAELELIKSEVNELPIVLLDDVASELDQKRIAFLFNLLSKMNAQIFVTTTQLGNLWNAKIEFSRSECKIFRVQNGIITF